MWRGLGRGILAAWLVGGCALGGLGQQKDDERYELRGKVVNAVSGAAVGYALVQVNGVTSGTQFSGADGSFVFSDLPRGRYQVVATKPGYFSARDLGRVSGWDVDEWVTGNTDATLKLTPEGVIYGRVEDENGQPVEGIAARAETWQVINGVKQLQGVGNAMTDDEGHFRIAELRPGTYYVSFVPEARRGTRRSFGAARRRSAGEEGFGPRFYPGVVDVGSATAVRVRGGSQIQIVQALKAQKLYAVSGVVRGTSMGKWFQVQLTNSSGEPTQRHVRLDEKTGEFQIEGVPEGTYQLAAMMQDPSGEDEGQGRPALTASTTIQVNRDVTGIVLVPGRGASVGVTIDDEIPAEGNELHQVQVSLTATGFRHMGQSMVIPPPPGEVHFPARFEGLEAGTYDVEVWPTNKGYVASVRSGSVDLMREELTVAQGATVPPIEVKLRNDGGEIGVEVKGNGTAGLATVVAYSEEYPKRSVTTVVSEGRGAFENLRPGLYKVVAFDGQREVEFRDPVAMEKYLGSGKEVNVRAGEKVSVQVEEVEGSEE